MMNREQIEATAARIRAKAVELQLDANDSKAEVKVLEEALSDMTDMLIDALSAIMPLDKALQELASKSGDYAQAQMEGGDVKGTRRAMELALGLTGIQHMAFRARLRPIADRIVVVSMGK